MNKFKIGDIVVTRAGCIGIVEDMFTNAWIGTTYLIDREFDRLIDYNENELQKAKDKDIIEFLTDEFLIECDEEFRFKTLDDSVEFNYYDNKVHVGCQEISLDDALDIAELIQSKIGR